MWILFWHIFSAPCIVSISSEFLSSICFVLSCEKLFLNVQWSLVCYSHEWSPQDNQRLSEKQQGLLAEPHLREIRWNPGVSHWGTVQVSSLGPVSPETSPPFSILLNTHLAARILRTRQEKAVSIFRMHLSLTALYPPLSFFRMTSALFPQPLLWYSQNSNRL